jgi:hypothetical protein
MLSDRPNEVIIKTTGGSLKDIDVYITNVQPMDTILLPTDDNYIDNLVSLLYIYVHFDRLILLRFTYYGCGV